MSAELFCVVPGQQFISVVDLVIGVTFEHAGERGFQNVVVELEGFDKRQGDGERLDAAFTTGEPPVLVPVRQDCCPAPGSRFPDGAGPWIACSRRGG